MPHALMSWLNRAFGADAAAPRRQAAAAYRRAILQARAPEFFTGYGVSDSVDGRFDMVVLHVFLLIHRLREDTSEPARRFVQALFDVMLDDLDQNVRQLGAQDIGVGRRVKAMAEAFNGRIHAYDAALGEGAEALERALARNVLAAEAADARARRLADYVRRNVAALAGQPTPEILQGTPVFAPAEPVAA